MLDAIPWLTIAFYLVLLVSTLVGISIIPRPGRGRIGIPGRGAGGGRDKPGGVSKTRFTTAITALDTLRPLDQTLEGTTDVMQNPSGISRLSRVSISVAVDYGAAVVSLATLIGVRLTGEGVGGGGLHEWSGPALTNQGVTSGVSIVQFTKDFDVNIPMQENATPTLQAAVNGDVAPGGVFVQVTFQYD